MQHVLGPEIRKAKDSGEYAGAFKQAQRELADLPLREALDRVLEEVDRDPALYDALAVRWILRVAEEKEFSIHLLNWSAARFDEHRVPHLRETSARIARLLDEF